MIYEAMLQVRDGGKILFKGSMPPDQPSLNEMVDQVLNRKLEGSGIVVKGFRLKVEAYEKGRAPDPSFKPLPPSPKPRVPTWKKREICMIIERFFGAKGYQLQRKPLRARGPLHLRVSHGEKDQDAVERDWDVINALVTEEFGWAPEVCFTGYHKESLLILNGTLR